MTRYLYNPQTIHAFFLRLRNSSHGHKRIVIYSLLFSLILMIIFTNSSKSSELKASKSGIIQVPEDIYTPANSFYSGRSYNSSSTNTTFNFGKLVYINVAQRYDRDDFMVLQSSISNIRPELFIGVDTASIDYKGLPPGEKSYINGLSPPAKACFRSHADVWRKMLLNSFEGDEKTVNMPGLHETHNQKSHDTRTSKSNSNDDSSNVRGLRSIFVLEADATWDVNITRSMFNFGRGLEQFLNKRGVLKDGEHATADDPWLSDHWDIIQMNGCFIGGDNIEYFQYVDPDSPATRSELDKNYESWDKSVGSPNRGYFEMDGKLVEPGHRMIRHRSQEACTAGYAISQRGARKILSKTSSHLRAPIDLVIRDMIWNKELDSYSSYPITFSQWFYAKGLGAASKNSDIRDIEDEKDDFLRDTEKDGSERKVSVEEFLKLKEKHLETERLWTRIHKNMYVWHVEQDDESRFANPALENLKTVIFGK